MAVAVFPRANIANELIVADACCGARLVHVLRKLGFCAQYSREVRPVGWNGMKKDRAILGYCKAKRAILVTKDRGLAAAARTQRVRVIELMGAREAFRAPEEAYIVLSRLGFQLHHFVLTSKVHFGLMFNMDGNADRPTVFNPSRWNRHHRVEGTDPLFQLPLHAKLGSGR